MAMAMGPKRSNFTFWTKWIASIAQICGYAATGFGYVPLNIYFFLVGLVGWFIVGVMWKDRAIMLIHIVALAAMVVGQLS
ncbi:DUF6552 family protein [Paracoccaceae bacterium GXU_MW_L88]